MQHLKPETTLFNTLSTWLLRPSSVVSTQV